MSEHRSLSHERPAELRRLSTLSPQWDLYFGILLRLTPYFLLPFLLGHLDGFISLPISVRNATPYHQRSLPSFIFICVLACRYKIPLRVIGESSKTIHLYMEEGIRVLALGL
jgi:hypothetical protein